MSNTPDAAQSRFSRMRSKVREKGILKIIAGRIKGYTWPLRMNNWYVGKYVETFGDYVVIQGLKFSVKSPLISTSQKSMLYFQIHENHEIELSKQYADASLPTVEFGGSIGVLACVTNLRLADPAKHVVVEANPVLIPTLVRNRKLNDCRFEILHAAVGYGSPMVHFFVNDDFLMGTIRQSDDQKVTVPTVSLKSIVEDRGFDAINLLVDIEGAEIGLVANELDVIKRHVKHLILETHNRFLGEGETSAMIDALEHAGFRILEGDRNAQSAAVLAFVNENLAGRPAVDADSVEHSPAV